ncbi:TIGR03826 family flagellar region protein [Brevibacillus invocatus]|uniref:TIGR03826 family flagellar region protein n=1 Tax=Brevibacillus invocatus TaxID=173959 RepID=UPI00203E5D8D|nr:TIGR03826 family flagellar region protein [Brevibacillus invocatus]MCM3079647.1 flagellar protein [Brevibacillus invocatus]MCM3431143.1 flagellar protein [Brevibacillus invocatus]
MSLGRLANCSRCDALFVRVARDICPKCFQEVEKEYELCSRFLRKRENRGSNIHQVSEATGVSVKQITKFIKEGRISVEGNPELGYPCESCGFLIRTGNICESCIRGLKHDITQDLAVEKRLKEQEKAQEMVAAYRRKQVKDE